MRSGCNRRYYPLMHLSQLSFIVLAIPLALSGCKDKDDKKPAKKVPTKPGVTTPKNPDTTKQPTAKTKQPTAKKPVAKKATRREKTKEYFDALHKGRALSNKKKHADALKAFDQALALVPGDSVVLSEISNSAFKTGASKRAEEAARASIKAATLPSIKASSLYNLGRVLEKNGDKKGALAAYLESHEVRPHPVVGKRITALGGAIPTLTLTLRPLLLTPDDQVATFGGNTGMMHQVKVKKPAPPIDNAYIQDRDQSCVLWISVAKKFYQLDEVVDCPGNNKYNHLETPMEMTTAGKQGVLKITLLEGSRDYTLKPGQTYDKRVWTTEETTSVIYCGAGASNKPTCTNPIVIKRSIAKEVKGAKPKISSVRTLKLGAGTLEVTANGKKKSYPLVFK